MKSAKDGPTTRDAMQVFLEVGCTIVLTITCSSVKNRSSPLLSLPQEIKDHIYGFLYSGHIIQIVQDDNLHLCDVDQHSEGEATPRLKDSDAPLQHYVCECSRSEQYPGNQDSIAILRDAIKMKILGQPCEGCSHSKKLDISLLKTCRQLHYEARRVLYFTNKFSFKNPRTLRLFGERSSHTDKIAIRDLRLVMNLPKGNKETLFKTIMGCLPLDEIEWSEAICLTVVNQLTRLQNIELYIVRGTSICGVEQAERNRSLSARSNEWITFILELRHLPLKSAKIVVHDWDYVFWPSLFEARTKVERIRIERGEKNLPELRWSLALKKKWADYARRIILRQIEYPDDRAVVSHSIVPIQNITRLSAPRYGRESFETRVHINLRTSMTSASDVEKWIGNKPSRAFFFDGDASVQAIVLVLLYFACDQQTLHTGHHVDFSFSQLKDV